MTTVLYYLNVFLYFFRRTYIANVCEHKTKRKGPVCSGADEAILELPLAENGRPDYCLKCIGEMSTRCAWCGDTIFVGDPITLLIPRGSFHVPEYAARYKEDPNRLVGCLGFKCCQSIAERQGFWAVPGTVRRVLSPIEMLMQAGVDGDAIIVLDASDPKNIGKIIKIGE